MEIILESYDDELTVKTRTGTSIRISPVEVKKQVGVAGTTDQLRISSALPVRVGKPSLSGANENWDRPELPDTREHTVYVLFGADHSDEIPLVKGYYAGDDDDDEEDDDDWPGPWALELTELGLGQPVAT